MTLLFSSFFERTERRRLCLAAANVGNWALFQQHYTPGELYPLCCLATEAEHLAILQWVQTQGAVLDEHPAVCNRAAARGHLKVLQWARAQGCPWSTWTCNLAAKYGHLKVLQWAREHDCPWGAFTSYHAAQSGHLEVLAWARQHGCPWDIDACFLTSFCRRNPPRYAVMTWILLHSPNPAQQLRRWAVRYCGNRWLIRWALDQGWTPPAQFPKIVLHFDRRHGDPWVLVSDLVRRLPHHTRITENLAAWRIAARKVFLRKLLPEHVRLVVAYL